MNEQQISNRQGSWIITAAVIGMIFLPLPKVVAAATGTAGWIAVIIGYSASLVPAYFIYQTSVKFKGKTIAEFNEILLGTVLGKVANGYLFFLYFYLTAMLTRQLGELYTIAIMPRTPIIVFSASMLFLVVFIIRQGLEVLVRVNELLLLVVVFSLIIMFALSLENISLDNFLPILGEGIGAILKGSLFTFAYSSAYVLLLGLLLPHFRDQQGSGKNILTGVLVGSFILNLTVIQTVGIFEVSEVRRFLYPVIQSAQVVEIGGFIKGIEVLLVGAWTAASLVATSLYFYGAVVFGARLFAIDDYREVVVTLAFLMVSVAMVPDNVVAMLNELRILTIVLFLSAVLVLPGTLFLLSRFKGDGNG